MAVKIYFLGTGPSLGTPVINCNCMVCLSDDYRDKRLRPSVLAVIDNYHILIDCSPDFRQQMLTNSIFKIDAVLFTHAHRDHTGGIPDLLQHFKTTPPEFYIPQHSKNIISQLIASSASESAINLKDIHIQNIDNKPVRLNRLNIIPVSGKHGKLDVTGYIFEKVAYLTDMNHLDETELEKIYGVDTLIISALQILPHQSHLTVDEAVEWAKKINARQTWLVHLGHDAGKHAKLQLLLPENIQPAYDGLIIEVL